ncbi:MAG TPA: hypothetical protein VIE44_06700 [Methylomirabilota bacterium]|jgi:hypothetical protein
MAEDSTRRLLRVFGIAMTSFEDALGELEAGLRGPGAAPGEPLEAYDRAAREVETRWAELGRVIQDHQARAREALVTALRARGVA